VRKGSSSSGLNAFGHSKTFLKTLSIEVSVEN